MIIKNNYQHLENKYQNFILNNKKEDNELNFHSIDLCSNLYSNLYSNLTA